MVLPIIGLCELGNCPQTTGCGVLRGTARLKLGLWLGLLAAQGSCAVTMMLIILVKTNWEDQARRAKELTDIINGDYDNQEEKTIDDFLDSSDYQKLENSAV
ncbi:hypothetical protein K7X08_013217 [Anisodus acutangulus]|uniref:Uncharacterized protein n=1 Tax=Anisodus acutangulus TaxID=402998 RepID=A0A9Q1MBC7_9SOLA|nr:hypothetical protein K7X08_013217 [Anisodus acutangulus]